MKRIKLAVLPLVATFFAVACGGSTASDGTPGDEADIKSSRSCGGVVPVHCAKGYVCTLDPNHPDQVGRCVQAKTGGQGSACGGIAGLGCNAGLTCVVSPPKTPDKQGTCAKTSPSPGAKLSKRGGFCDDGGGHDCEEGLRCCDTSATCVSDADTCDNS
jgi:hypothetical protein